MSRIGVSSAVVVWSLAIFLAHPPHERNKKSW
jgi:hypothetical protein